MRRKVQSGKLALVPMLFGGALLGMGLVWSASGVAQTGFEGTPSSEDQPTQLTVIRDEVINRLPAIGPDPELGDVDLVQGPEAPARRSVLVYLEPPGGGRAERAEANRLAVREFAANVGGTVRYEYKVLPNVLNLRDIPATALAQLEQMPGVQRVEEDTYDIRINLDESTPLINALQSQITGAGLSADGAGIRVCVVDTGIDSDHIMYADRIDASAGYDFYNDDPDPEDDHGHGSHVSGIAVGGTGLVVDLGCEGQEPFQGVAPEATLIGVKVLNSWGGGYDSDIIAGIDHCADQSPSGGRADVINLSIGTGQYSGPCSHSWAVAANNAVANGVVVVAASGNNNYSNAMTSPACGIDVIAVGATYKDDYPNCEDSTSTFYWSNCTDVQPDVDQVTCFSNESDYLDVAAPGAVILSASTTAGGSSITGMSGTSMASPHVAGLAALILSADPSLTPAEVRQVIRDGAIDMGATGFDRGYGYGRVDAINSLQLVSGPECNDDPDCNDGLWCNGAETCVSGSCEAGTPPDCDDGVACTVDSCNESTDSCDNVPNDGLCDNGLYCDGFESCDPVLGCQAGTAVDCNDGIACTIDSCNEGTDACDHAPDDGYCNDGLFCNGAESCDPLSGCEAGTDPCPGQFCDEAGDVCVDCFNDDDCDDGLFCNGAESCVGGTCQAGGDPCPGQACDEVTDSCVDCISDGDCDDGLFCNGAETCVSGTCQTGQTINCDDGVTCTVDSCNEATDSCDHVPDDDACDNGIYCDGAETCDPVAGCQAGTAVDCDDGVGCTTDSCNEGTDSCDNVPDNAACSDGLFCNGAETCDPLNDCQPGSDPCPGQDCDEANDSCVPPVCDNDGVCDSGEDCYNCPNDCISGDGPICGNGLCETADGEDCVSCPADCNGVQTGKPSGRWCCGDGDGVNPVDCDDPRCTDGGNSCTDIPAPPFCCGDLVCEGSEDGFNCEIDCGTPPFCGDGTCDPSEDQCSCPGDCGTPPGIETECADGIDEDCDGLTDCDDGDCISDPACECLPRDAVCTLDDECCSGRCHRGTCK